MHQPASLQKPKTAIIIRDNRWNLWPKSVYTSIPAHSTPPVLCNYWSLLPPVLPAAIHIEVLRTSPTDHCKFPLQANYRKPCTNQHRYKNQKTAIIIRDNRWNLWTKSVYTSIPTHSTPPALCSYWCFGIHRFHRRLFILKSCGLPPLITHPCLLVPYHTGY